jgi:hypothetical protein
MGGVGEGEVDAPLLEQVDIELRRTEVVVGETQEPGFDLRLEFDRPLDDYITDEIARSGR